MSQELWWQDLHPFVSSLHCITHSLFFIYQPWQQMDNAVYTFEQLLHQSLETQGEEDLCKTIQRCQDRVIKVKQRNNKWCEQKHRSESKRQLDGWERRCNRVAGLRWWQWDGWIKCMDGWNDRLNTWRNGYIMRWMNRLGAEKVSQALLFHCSYEKIQLTGR